MKSGAEQFKDWIERRFPNSTRKARDASELLGWDETFISKIVAGVRLPGLANALKIERETGIPVEAWESSEVDTDKREKATSGKKTR